MSLVDAGWDAEVARRPHGQHTTVVMHLDVKDRAASLHLGPLLSEPERRYLDCDATYEVWFERDGQVIGAGRTTRQINRRLRRALEHRHPTCAVPGRGLHAHHIRHWEDGGSTELANLVLVCPYHHRLHHRGIITITGPGRAVAVTDSAGRPLSAAALARPPKKPRPPSRPARGPPVSAPNGGGPTLPAATTTDEQLVWSPGPVNSQQHVETQTDWGSGKAPPPSRCSHSQRGYTVVGHREDLRQLVNAVGFAAAQPAVDVCGHTSHPRRRPTEAVPRESIPPR